MKVLIACEFSGVVRRAFRERGHNAWSCDLLPTLDNSPHHLHMDAGIPLMDRGWDLMIAHPPCTRLCNSGVSWLARRDLWDEMYEACNFFNQLKGALIPRICIENPVPHKYARALIGDYTQTIQPYQFGHGESKRTCLWLKNLPPLHSTDILPLPESGHWDNQTPSGQNKLGPGPTRAMLRSITYQGIANAMADQWGILNG